MPTVKKKPKGLFPLQLSADVVAESEEDIATLIVREAKDQVKSKRLTDREDRVEFLMGCLALLCWRVRLRIEEDLGKSEDVNDLMRRVLHLVCDQAGIDEDEFGLAMAATKDRPRLPYGYTPLELALARAKKRPIRLLVEGATESKLLALVAGLARQLQRLQDGPIFLPVDDVRELLGLRKLAVSGAIKQLVEHGLLVYVDETYHTGRARTFKFAGKLGKHFERETDSKMG